MYRDKYTRAQHKTPSCTRFESNRRLRRETIQKGDIAQEQVHVSLKSRSQARTHTHIWYVCEALHLCTHGAQVLNVDTSNDV